MVKKWMLVSVCVFAALPFAFASDEKTGKVINVIDGNTIEVDLEGEGPTKVMLADIDCPELDQEFGIEAKLALEKMLLKKDVVIQIAGKDRKGTPLAIVLVKRKIDVRISLLQQGLAWTAERNPKPELEIHRDNARLEGKGLWKSQNPTPPWVFRREQSMLQPKSS